MIGKRALGTKIPQCRPIICPSKLTFMKNLKLNGKLKEEDGKIERGPPGEALTSVQLTAARVLLTICEM